MYGLGIGVLILSVVAVGRVVVCGFFRNAKCCDTFKAYSFFSLLCIKLRHYYQLCLYDTGFGVSVEEILHFVYLTKWCHMLAICN